MPWGHAAGRGERVAAAPGLDGEAPKAGGGQESVPCAAASARLAPRSTARARRDQGDRRGGALARDSGLSGSVGAARHPHALPTTLIFRATCAGGSMALEIRRKALSEQNPWWDSPGAIQKDPSLASYRGDIIHEAVSYLLDMPRQLVQGQSAFHDMTLSPLYMNVPAAKLKVLDLLNGGVEPRCVFYYDFENGSAGGSLKNAIREYLEMSRGWKDTHRCYMLLDRLTNMPEWREVLRSLYRDGMLANCTVVTFRVSEQRANSTMSTTPWTP